MMATTSGDDKILGLSAYKEVATISNCILLSWLPTKVSLLMHDDNEQVRIQAAKLLWRLGNLLGSK